MAKAAQHAELKAAFEKHLGETEGQIDRLEQVFAEIDKKPQGKTSCDAIVGIAKEGQEIIRTNTKACLPTTRGCSPRLRPLNTTESTRCTARFALGPKNSVTPSR